MSTRSWRPSSGAALPVVIALLAAPLPAVAQVPITIGDATVSESGTTGTDQIRFPVRLNRVTIANGDTTTDQTTVVVHFQGQSGTANVASYCSPGVDIALQASAITIFGSVSEEFINATLCDDALDEVDAETFTVTLTSAMGGSIQDNQATGTVLDNDRAPSLRVDDVAAQEGAVGEQRVLTFSIRLTEASGRQVSVNYAVTAGGGAIGGAACGGAVDFVTRSGQETFASGTTSRPVGVTVCGDGRFESGETMTLTLTGPADATIQDGTAVGTISNDDPQPMVTVTAPAGNLTEGNSGQQTATVQVALSNANHDGASVTFDWGGTALRGAGCNGAVDIVTTGPQAVVTWPANNNDARTVSFEVCGDGRDDANDTVVLTAGGTSVAGVAAGSQNVTMVITDDDPSPAVSVGDAVGTEGSMVDVSVTLSAVSNLDVEVLLTAEPIPTPPAKSIELLLRQVKGTVSGATMGSSCSGATDFLASSHRYRIPAGQTTGGASRFRACANVDLGLPTGRSAMSVGTGVEVFQVRASSPDNATLAKALALVAIREP